MTNGKCKFTFRSEIFRFLCDNFSNLADCEVAVEEKTEHDQFDVDAFTMVTKEYVPENQYLTADANHDIVLNTSLGVYKVFASRVRVADDCSLSKYHAITFVDKTGESSTFLMVKDVIDTVDMRTKNGNFFYSNVVEYESSHLEVCNQLIAMFERTLLFYCDEFFEKFDNDGTYDREEHALKQLNSIKDFNDGKKTWDS